MGTAFPGALDGFDDNKIVDLEDALKAVEAKVGINSSVDTSSLDHRASPNTIKNFNQKVRFRRRPVCDAQHPDFGATPGGTAAVNNAALQYWLDACRTEDHPGYLPPDTLPYDISTGLTFTQKSGWRLEGNGAGHPDTSSLRSRIRWTGAAGGTMLLLQGVQHGHLRDIMLDGNSLAAFGIDYDAVSTGLVSTENIFERIVIARATDRGLRIGKSNFQTDLTEYYSCQFFANSIGTSLEDANAIWHTFFGCRWTHNTQDGITASSFGNGGHFDIYGGHFLANGLVGNGYDIRTFASRVTQINALSERSNRFLRSHLSNSTATAAIIVVASVETIRAPDRVGIQHSSASPMTLRGSFKSNDNVRVVTDAATTSGSPTLTSASAAFTAQEDIDNLPLAGAGIPAGTYVLTRISATEVTMSANATATATGVTVTLGKSFKITAANLRRSNIEASGAGFDGNPWNEGNFVFNGLARAPFSNYAIDYGTTDAGFIDGAIPYLTPTTAFTLATTPAGGAGVGCGWAELVWVKVASGTALVAGANLFYFASNNVNGKCGIEVPSIHSHGGADAVLLGVEGRDDNATQAKVVRINVRCSAAFTLTSNLVFAVKVRPEPVTY
jgi:hypothetical protein